MAPAGPTTSESLEQHLIRTNNPKAAQELMVRMPTPGLSLVLMLELVHALIMLCKLMCLLPVAMLYLLIWALCDQAFPR